MFQLRRKPLYTIADIHTYIGDIERLEQQKAKTMDSGDPDPAGQYEDILHVMREVLLRMVERLEPKERKKLEGKDNGTTGNRE